MSWTVESAGMLSARLAALGTATPREDLDTLMQQMRGYPPSRVAAVVWDWMRAQGFRDEKAHTPTDDEREALIEQFTYRIQEAVAYGGNGELLSNKIRNAWIEDQVDLAMRSHAVRGFRSSEVPEPSDGWSDASVIAALTAYDPDGVNHASWTEGAISDMRAALAAASAAKKAQREHEAGQHISDLIERSSLGTPDAQALRATVSEEKARALVAEADRRSEPQGEPTVIRCGGGCGAELETTDPVNRRAACLCPRCLETEVNRAAGGV